MYKINFNNIDMPDFVKVIGRGLKTSSSLDVQSVSSSIGQRHTRTKIGSKELPIDIIIKPDKEKSLDEQLDELNEWLIGNDYKPSKLIFPEQPDFYLWANVSGSTEIKDDLRMGTGSINFVALNPIKYSINPIIQTGLSKIIIDYKGIIKGSPIITLTMKEAANSIEVVNEQDLKNHVILNHPFKANDVIVIDNEKRKVTLNGQVNMKMVAFQSKWLQLKKGSNKIIIRQNNNDTTTTNSPAIKVEHRILK